jgi:uncharacterized membrane protein (UPF0127 family)
MVLSPLLSLCLLGCSSNSTEDSLSTLPRLFTDQGDSIYLEIADDSKKRRDGLMFRTQLDTNKGMVFVFEDESTRSFWMKNTLIPLDVIYLSSDLMIVDIQSMPPCGDLNPCPSYPSYVASRYAVELNAGTADRLHLEIGDFISFENTSF